MACTRRHYMYTLHVEMSIKYENLSPFSSPSSPLSSSLSLPSPSLPSPPLPLSSQFHRSLPGPPDLTPAEVSSLVQCYRDPSSGLYNYMQFHNDIERLRREEEEEGGSGPPQPPSAPVRTIPGYFYSLMTHFLIGRHCKFKLC